MEVDAAPRHPAVAPDYEEDADETDEVVEIVDLEEEMGDADSIERFPDDETEEGDTTAEQYPGRDIQGIAWERLQFTREAYRENRLKQYRNYTNVLDAEADAYREDIAKDCSPVRRDGHYYNFLRNNRAVHSTIMHFQLRNLVWATSQNDVFVVYEHCVNHWSPVTRTTTTVLNLTGPPRAPRLPGVGHSVQISTLCVSGEVVAAGGFTGELVVKRLSSPTVSYSGRVTSSENGITNAIEIFDSPRLGHCLMASNNDNVVRIFDLATMAPKGRHAYPWAVNCSMLQPTSGTLLAVVGDDLMTHLTDSLSGKTVNQLKGHRDYSFAVAWHPDGNMLATGNQDTTTLVWDIRQTQTPLAMLPGRMGAIRSIRFSADGAYMAVAEPADFVHIYDVRGGFEVCQEIDIFGEIAGFSFSPDAEDLVVGVADMTYSSLLHYERHHDREHTDVQRLMPYQHSGLWC